MGVVSLDSGEKCGRDFQEDRGPVVGGAKVKACEEGAVTVEGGSAGAVSGIKSQRLRRGQGGSGKGTHAAKAGRTSS